MKNCPKFSGSLWNWFRIEPEVNLRARHAPLCEITALFTPSIVCGGRKRGEWYDEMLAVGCNCSFKTRYRNKVLLAGHKLIGLLISHPNSKVGATLTDIWLTKQWLSGHFYVIELIFVVFFISIMGRTRTRIFSAPLALQLKTDLTCQPEAIEKPHVVTKGKTIWISGLFALS